MLAVLVNPYFFGGEARARQAAHQRQRPTHVARRERDRALHAARPERCGDRVVAGFVAHEGTVGIELPLSGRNAPGGREPRDRLAGRVLGGHRKAQHVASARFHVAGRQRHGRQGGGHRKGHALRGRTGRGQNDRPAGPDGGDQAGGAHSGHGRVLAPPRHAVTAYVAVGRKRPRGGADTLAHHELGSARRQVDARGRTRHGGDLDHLEHRGAAGDGGRDRDRQDCGRTGRDQAQRIHPSFEPRGTAQAVPDADAGEHVALRVARFGAQAHRIAGDHRPAGRGDHQSGNLRRRLRRYGGQRRRQRNRQRQQERGGSEGTRHRQGGSGRGRAVRLQGPS